MATAASFASGIPIAQLQPGLDAEATSVTGVVTLIWPYASSTQSTSLLLVEPDFRLRGHRGQVRVHFNGASARTVAKSGLGSGDRLSMSLKGSAWTKDSSSTTTPGRSIEWELKYGERVLLEIQRDSQKPEILEIDHPPASPNTPIATLSRESLPYQTHSVTWTPAPFLNGQTWESPAFLKRTHTKSSYDPFAIEDEEEEFPDNDRRKRSKFGRGSGQWRFADRTPSPEKSLALGETEVESPSKPQVDLQRVQETGGKDNVLLEEQEMHEELKEAEEEPDTDRDYKGLGQQVQEVNGHLDHKGASNAPLSPPSTTSGTSEAEASGTVTPAKETFPSITRSSSTRSIYSASDSSSSDQDLKSDGDEPEAEHSDGAAFRGSASDFGLDGAAYSRLQPPQQARLTSEPAIEEVVRTEIDTIDHLPELEPTSRSPKDLRENRQGLSTEPATIKETAHEFQILDDDTDASIGIYVQETIDTHRRDVPSAPSSPSNQLQEQPILDISFPNFIKVQADTEQHELEPARMAVHSSEFEEEPSKDVLESVEPQATDEDPATITNQSLISRVNKVEIINLESDDEDDEENEAQDLNDHLSRSPSARSKSPVAKHLPDELNSMDPIKIPNETPLAASRTPSPSMTEHGIIASFKLDVAERNALAEHEPQAPSPQMSSASIVEDIRDDETIQLHPRDAERLPLQQIDSVASPTRSPHSDVQVPSPRDSHRAKTDTPEPELINARSSRSDDSTQARIQQEVDSLTQKAPSPQWTDLNVPSKTTPALSTTADSQDSVVELPAIVQDSILQLPYSKGHLLTPDTTQKTSFGSQPSMNSLHYISDDEKPLTSQLTQSKSTDLIVPIALQGPPDRLPSVKSPTPPKKTVAQADKAHSSEKVSAPQRPSNLIERLKSLKRLSNQSAQNLGDPSVTSPWFTPRKSSIIVPDSEAESEVESLSEDDRQSTKPVIEPNFQTPEKQNPLAKAFIRSPNQQGGIHSITSSPGYLPPSQPPPPGFRTSLSYFVPLATLQSHFTLAVDILAIVVGSTSVTRATSGPKDYNQTIYISDPSSSVLSSPIVTAQIFRSHNKCFPLLEQGDALLLRDFKVQSFQKQLSLLSTQSSAWAVFRKDTEVQVRGPPVEFGAEERGFARGLWRWWGGLDRRVKDGLGNSVPREKEKGSMPPSKKRSEETPSKEKNLDDGDGKSEARLKKQSIAGLGVDLPGSQKKTRTMTKQEKSLELEANLPSSQGKTRKELPKEGSVDMDHVLESTEPPKRVLRPRGAKGKAERSESPMKAINRRSGTVFEGGIGEPKSRFSV